MVNKQTQLGYKRNKFKIYYDNELTYVDLLLPILEIVYDVTLKQKEIEEILIEAPLTKPYKISEIIKASNYALKHLNTINFVTFTKGNIVEITQEAIEFYDSFLQKRKLILKKRNIKNQLKNLEISTIREINKKIAIFYGFPNNNYFHKVFLEYIHEHPSDQSNVLKYLLVNIILDKIKLSDENMSLIDVRSKETLIYSKMQKTISHLKNKNLIDNHENKFYITPEGEKYLQKTHMENLKLNFSINSHTWN